MRLLLLPAGGALIALALFALMAAMVSSPTEQVQPQQAVAQINFLRQQDDSDLREKERSLPPPPDVPPAPPVADISAISAPDIPRLDMPQIKADFNVEAVAGTGNLLAGIGMMDTEAMPLVRPDATYPAKAYARRIEGFVKARLTINEEGTVSHVEVLESQPPGVFDREAVRALYRYRFEPKKADGVAVTQTATQTIEFSLK